MVNDLFKNDAAAIILCPTCSCSQKENNSSSLLCSTFWIWLACFAGSIVMRFILGLMSRVKLRRFSARRFGMMSRSKCVAAVISAIFLLCSPSPCVGETPLPDCMPHVCDVPPPLVAPTEGTGYLRDGRCFSGAQFFDFHKITNSRVCFLHIYKSQVL